MSFIKTTMSSDKRSKIMTISGNNKTTVTGDGPITITGSGSMTVTGDGPITVTGDRSMSLTVQSNWEFHRYMMNMIYMIVFCGLVIALFNWDKYLDSVASNGLFLIVRFFNM